MRHEHSHEHNCPCAECATIGPTCCDSCQDTIPDGTGWYEDDVLMCDTCHKMAVRLEHDRAIESRIRAEYEPGEDDRR